MAQNGDSTKTRKDTVRRPITLQKVEVTGRPVSSFRNSSSSFGAKIREPVIDIPQSVSTVNKELIQDKMEFTLKDAADNVAGVGQYSGYDEYTIRGFRAENARDIDGLRGYNVTYTSPLLVNIERVEIIKGPTATLYGNCDPGGTINLVTKKPLNTAGAWFSMYRGSWDHFRAEADVTGPVNTKKTWLYRFNAGYDDGNSFRDHVFSGTYMFAPAFSFDPNDKLSLNANFSVSHISTVLDRGQPGLENDHNLLSTPVSLSVIQPGDYLHETDIASIVSLNYRISAKLSFYAGYLDYITRQDVAEHGINSYISPDSVALCYTAWHYPTTTNTLNSYFTYRFGTGSIGHRLLFGYDRVRSSVNLDQQYYELPGEFGQGSGIVGTLSLLNPQYTRRPVAQYQPSGYDDDASDVDDDVYHTQGVYAQDELSLGKLKLLAGICEEFYKGDDDSAGSLKETVFLPRIGLVYRITPNVNWYATYNKGFDPFEAATSAQVFDQPFKPIISRLWETGIKGNILDQRLYASLAIYRLTVQNVAVNANDLSNPDLFVQQGENRSQGAEAELAGNILPDLSVMLAYAHCVAKVTKSDVPSQIGTLVENAPVNSGSGWIRYTRSKGKLKGLVLSGGYTFAGRRNTLDPATVLPGYVVFSGGVRYSYKRWMLALNVNNITGETYWSGAYNNIYKWPGEPRNCMLGLGFRL
ncbi:MAG TPA: TonB-dependent siderophore receptor [Mucilaginibacter sp.]|nr:TonB-dependent siderophore receptor [Mucilaginibacter sp.]